MGDFADVKRSKMYSLLRWLETKPQVTINDGGRHQYLVKCQGWPRPFPVPLKHSTVNKHIVKKLMEQLIASGICNEDEFRERVR